MNKEIKEIYFSNLKWIKTHDNIGGVAGNLIFKDNMPYEEYLKLFKTTYFALCNKDYITKLQAENKKLNEWIDNRNDYVEFLLAQNDRLHNIIISDDLQEENEKLNNVINEFGKWLEERKIYYCKSCSHTYEDSLGKTRLVNEDIFNEITKIKDKLEELKGE